MKTKRIIHFCMVALMTSMLFSCNGCEDDAYGPEAVTYSVSLCFIDSTGKDLVAGLIVIGTGAWVCPIRLSQ